MQGRREKVKRNPLQNVPKRGEGVGPLCTPMSDAEHFEDNVVNG